MMLILNPGYVEFFLSSVAKKLGVILLKHPVILVFSDAVLMTWETGGSSKPFRISDFL